MLPSYELGVVAARLARRALSDDVPTTKDRQAAVAAILRAPLAPGAKDAELLLIRRADRAGDPWSGHMALPGGRREPTDESLFAAAVRETREEVGIDIAAHGALLARLPDIQAVARGKRVGMVVAPFVVALRTDTPLTPNEEVAEALWTPLGPLARGETAAPYPYVHEGRNLSLPSLRVGERIVWGLTYQMLTALFDALHAP